MSICARRPVAGRDQKRLTIVSFHAHPDDEALLTGGTLAGASAAGHRVVLVTATCGERGLAGGQDGTGDDLARTRVAELQASARSLGCARVVLLGYADSGMHTTADPASARCAFSRVGVASAAEALAEILREESADVLTIYDQNGGYGHPDHVQVHRVGTLAAQLADTPCVLEATVPGSLFRLALRLLALVGHPLGSSAPLGIGQVFSDRRRITHRVRVTPHLEAKRAALAAHASQRRGAGQVRVLDRLVALPKPLFALVLGHEWFIEQGRAPSRRVPRLIRRCRSLVRSCGRADRRPPSVRAAAARRTTAP